MIISLSQFIEPNSALQFSSLLLLIITLISFRFFFQYTTFDISRVFFLSPANSFGKFQLNTTGDVR